MTDCKIRQTAASRNQLSRFAVAAAVCGQSLRYKPDFELARNNLRFAEEMMAKARTNKADPVRYPR
jgi:hypothetical protein